MGGGEEEAEAEAQGLSDIENTVFVAVGKNVKESKSTLLWALQSFAGCKICLLHVHQPAHSEAARDGSFSVNKLKQRVVKAWVDLEREDMHKLLDQYLRITGERGVQASKVWIEMDNVEKGIIQIIAQHNCRWLVMGAAAEKHYSRKLSKLKSKKSIFVCQQAQASCHIWFTCNGCLIYTRARCSDVSSHVGSIMALSGSSGTESPQSHANAEEDSDELEGMLRGFTSKVLMHSTKSVDTVEEKSDGRATFEICDKLEHAKIDAENSMQKTFEESLRRWKAEEDAMEATHKAEELESLCMKEIQKREEMEEVLARCRLELERMRNQHDQYTQELQMICEQKPVLESQLMKSHSAGDELVEKIIQAANLLIIFKEKRDKLQIERDNAIQEVNGLRKLVKVDAADLCRVQFFAFSFWEINEATRDFDPSWKIGDGRYGSVYKGFLHHLKVAIKMLPSHGCQGPVEFENETQILSRVRHANLVNLVGTCPESRSLIYEYIENGSLEDRLACRGKKTPPLSWQTRIKIASEICSALVFIHSNRPCMLHGNLKPSKVLLDPNFVSKLCDTGIYRLIPKDQRQTYISCNKRNPEASVYVDPEFLETGELTVESDVYSFGVVLLRLLTGRPAVGVVKDVKCALEKEKFSTVLDLAAGEWPPEQAKNLARLALRCCEDKWKNRPDLASEVWIAIEQMRKKCTPSSHLDSKGPPRIPSHFVCPIFQEVMKDPHIAADGFTYEADAIQGWLKSGHDTSPMTNLKLDHCDLLPNHALSYAIQEWRQQHS